MKQNIKRALKFGIPFVIVFTILISFLAGLREGFLPGLLIGLIIGGLLALAIGFVNSDIAKDGFEDFHLNKEQRIGMKSNFKRILPALLIVLIGSFFTRYTGNIYTIFIITMILGTLVIFLQSIKSGEYKKAREEGELAVFYAVLLTTPISLFPIFIISLLVAYGGNVKGIIDLL